MTGVQTCALPISDEPSGYYVEEIIEGNTIVQSLAAVQYEESELKRRMKAQVDEAIKTDKLKPNEAMRLLWVSRHRTKNLLIPPSRLGPPEQIHVYRHLGAYRSPTGRAPAPASRRQASG